MACCQSCAQENTTARGLGFLSTGSFEDADGYGDWDWFGDYAPAYDGGYELSGDYGWLWDEGWWDAPDGYWDWLGEGFAPAYDPYADVEDIGFVFGEDTSEAVQLPTISGGNFPLYIPQPDWLEPDWNPRNDVWADAPPPPPAQQLPGVCPRGYYHPLEAPLTCVPFPPAQTAAQRRQQQAQQRRQQQQAKQQAQQRAAQQQQQRAQQCAQAGLVYNAKTQKCECPQGTKPNAQTKRCERAGTAPLVNRSVSASKQPLPWWVVLVGAAIAYKVVNDNGGGRRRR